MLLKVFLMSRLEIAESIRNYRDVKMTQPGQINENYRKQKIILYFNKGIFVIPGAGSLEHSMQSQMRVGI